MMIDSMISKPVRQILTALTGEVGFESALYSATKELLHLKIKDAEEKIKQFEARYKMPFDDFKGSHDVEEDYREWEAAIIDQQHFQRMLKEVPKTPNQMIKEAMERNRRRSEAERRELYNKAVGAFLRAGFKEEDFKEFFHDEEERSVDR